MTAKLRGTPSGGTRMRAALAFALALFLASAAAAVRSGAQASPPASGAPQEPAGEGAPIAFSHRVHALDNGLDCQLCHAYARRGPVAGLPPVARCAGCHRFVVPDSVASRRILARLEAGAPIAWPRVHRLPGHVRFTHKRHVRAGVACQDCHGDVAAMRTVEQVAPLTMGWCVACHEQRQAPDDCLTCHY